MTTTAQTETSVRILRYLDREAYSIPEIAGDLGLSVSVVRAEIKKLLDDLRVQKLGTSASGARCYGITQLGRERLAATKEQGR